MDDWIARTKRQQDLMRSLAKSKYWEEGEELEHVLGMISILEDFYDDMRSVDMDNIDVGDIEGHFIILYANIDTFTRVCSDYYSINGALNSNIEWGEITPKSVKQLLDRTYNQFEIGTDFYMKVRNLLDMFKMSLVLMGLIYGNPKD